MFTTAGTRSASAYKTVAVQTSVDMANPHKLVSLLFDALRQDLGMAKLAMQNKDIPAKCTQIGHAIRIIEDGLKAPLDLERGGEIAQNLNALYDYCVNKLMLANSRNDVSALDEVTSLLEPIAESWKMIKGDGPAYLRPV